jgi:hypothetical protein
MMCGTRGGRGTDRVFLIRAAGSCRGYAVRTVRGHRKGWAGSDAEAEVGVAGFSKEKWPPDGAVRALLEYLDELHRGFGQPSYAQMGGAVGLAASTVAPFFTGTRLIGEGNLELLVEYLGGDKASAERLRKKAATEWGTRPQPAHAAPPGPGAPRRRRLHYFIEAGRGLGTGRALTGASMPPDESVDFLDTLHLIGLQPGEIAPFREIRRRLPAESDEARQALVCEYTAVRDDVINLVENRSSDEERRWFRFGRLVHSVALVAMATWPEDPGQDIEGARTGLFYLSDLLDVPEGFRNEVKSYSTMTLPTAGRTDVSAEAERLTQACYAFL